MKNLEVNKKRGVPLWLFFSIVILVGLVGYYIGIIFPFSELNIYKNSFEDVNFPFSEEIVLGFTGTIKSIGESIVLEIPPLEERIVNLKDETEIIEQIFLFSEQGVLSLPETTPIELSELKIGDTIIVESDENIKTKKEFTASKIILIKNQINE